MGLVLDSDQDVAAVSIDCTIKIHRWDGFHLVLASSAEKLKEPVFSSRSMRTLPNAVAGVRKPPCFARGGSRSESLMIHSAASVTNFAVAAYPYHLRIQYSNARKAGKGKGRTGSPLPVMVA